MKLAEARMEFRAPASDILPRRPTHAPSTADIDEMAALRGVFGIFALWDIPATAQRVLLGQPPERTFYNWKAGKGRHVPADTLRRIGYIAGIEKALELLYSDAAQRYGWLCRENRAFGGQTPLDRMAAGDVTDLAAVRAYLDAARSPW